tara:strand:+ start:415 stop:2586 length:2172 start_codon:yes stop_codon:yes gene_type:complete
MNNLEPQLIKAHASRIVIELRIAEGGETADLKDELEEAQGTIDTLTEFLDGMGTRALRPEQIKSQAISMVIANTGRAPHEIARILESPTNERVQKAENGVTARMPRSYGTPEGDVWQRCKEDFVYFCVQGLEIKYRAGLNPDFPRGGFGAFTPNEHQVRVAAVLIDDWLNGKPVRAIILKARQLGITTVLLAYWLWMIIQKDNFVVMFLIDKDPHMYEKRDMILDWAKKLSDRFAEAPTVRAHGGKRIVWSNKSKILFESAQSPNPGTSEHIDAIHLSEMPKWPKGKAQSVMKSLVPGLPEAEGTFIINESTAEGMGYFYRQWNRIMAGEEVGVTQTKPLFLPWWLSPEYSTDPPGMAFDKHGDFKYLNEDKEVCETNDYGEVEVSEEDYQGIHKLTVEQIYWRRLQIKNKFQGVREDFDQEYPTTPDHAWAAFGSLFFGSKCAKDATDTAQEPIMRGHILDANGNNDPSKLYAWTRYKPVVSPDRTGNLRIYKRPVKDESYFIGGDIAEGKKVESQGGKQDPDYSVLTVLDKYGELVALYRGRTKPEEMALPAILLGALYNVAWINVERNSVGEATWAFFKQSGYNQIYLRSGNGPYEDRGWNKTTRANRKPMLIEMRHHLRKHPSHVVSAELAHELNVFITNNDGKPEAMPGEHDDIVMAYTHAWHMIFDITGVRVEIVEEIPEPPAELEFWNVMEFNGVNHSGKSETHNYNITDLEYWDH